MCRFHRGEDYIQEHISGLDKEVSGQFVDIPFKLRRIVKHSKRVPSFTDMQGKMIDGFRVQALYKRLEA